MNWKVLCLIASLTLTAGLTSCSGTDTSNTQVSPAADSSPGSAMKGDAMKNDGNAMKGDAMKNDGNAMKGDAMKNDGNAMKDDSTKK